MPAINMLFVFKETSFTANGPPCDKTCLEVSEIVRLKPVSSATETS